MFMDMTHVHMFMDMSMHMTVHREMHTEVCTQICGVTNALWHWCVPTQSSSSSFPSSHTHPLMLDPASCCLKPSPLFRNSWHLTPALLPNMTLPTTEDPSVCIGSLRCWAFLFTCQARLPSPTEVEALLWELQGLLHSKHLVSCRDSQP